MNNHPTHRGINAMSDTSAQSGQRGQILVIFVIAIVAVIGMVGLVLDGGSAFAQRREEQNVSDLAAMAGATAYLNATGSYAVKSAAATQAAQEVAVANGYTHGTGGVAVNVAVASTALAASVQVDVTRPHRNNFAALMGMPTWTVSVTATAVSSDSPNAANGAMPLLFNAEAFPGAICDEDNPPCTSEVYELPGIGNEDVPQDATQFNWTIFCTASGNPCNANSDGVRELIDGNGSPTTVSIGDEIGPLNSGAHTTLFSALQGYVGGTFPVPIVDDNGDMLGFAYFKLLSVEGASQKVITGYFVSPVNADQLVVNPNAPGATLETGTYSIKLTN
ncbi:MAG: pilus assembly protein TadG-related protein [Candidatus Limnocylindrales bacterium]